MKFNELSEEDKLAKAEWLIGHQIAFFMRHNDKDSEETFKWIQAKLKEYVKATRFFYNEYGYKNEIQ